MNNIRDLIEEVERVRDNVMMEVSRLDHILGFLYQKESEEALEDE